MTGHKTLELMGSGEFEPWSEEVDRFSLSRADFGDGSVVILPTASAPEGDEVFNRWAGIFARSSFPRTDCAHSR